MNSDGPEALGWSPFALNKMYIQRFPYITTAQRRLNLKISNKILHYNIRKIDNTANKTEHKTGQYDSQSGRHWYQWSNKLG